jgi:hypothetical protein
MIENNVFLSGGEGPADYGLSPFADRRRNDPACSPPPTPAFFALAVHRSCGQLCGQSLRGGRKPACLQDLQRFAELMRTKNLNEINHLLHRDRLMTVVLRAFAGITPLWSSGAPSAAVGAAHGME